MQKVMQKALLCVAAGLLPAATLMADFKYEQTSTMTGGSMMAMMRMAGGAARNASQPSKTTHYLKGDRMATVSDNTMSIVDVAAETITEVDLQKKTWSVMTFAEMKQMMERMGDKGAAGVSFRVSAKPTGVVKKVNGFDAKEIVVTMEGESKDPRSGKSGTISITTDSWFASDIPGYEEVQAFGRKMAGKMDWTAGAAGGMMGRPDMAKGMAEVAKEMAKIGGVPVLQVMKMSGGGPGGDMPQLTPEQQAQMAQAMQQADAARQQAAQQQAQQSQERPSVGNVLGGALGGRLSGIGGLGRKKAAPDQTQQTASAPPPLAAAAPASSGGDPSVLMETTIEMTNFSASAVDASKLEVPAGFKKVESRMAGR